MSQSRLIAHCTKSLNIEEELLMESTVEVKGDCTYVSLKTEQQSHRVVARRASESTLVLSEEGLVPRVLSTLEGDEH